MSSTIDPESTVNLRTAFEVQCCKCQSRNVQVEIGGNHYIEEIYIKCCNCSSFACVYSVYTDDDDLENAV